MLHASVSASYERSRATRQAHMATRHLQKLRGEEVQPLDTQDSEASESEEACTGPLNPFDLLDDNEGEGSEAEDVAAPQEAAPALQPKSDAQPNSAKKKKKTKQKQKKASNGATYNVPIAAAKKSSQSQQRPNQAEEDIDQLLASLNITQSAAPEASTSGRTTTKSKADEPSLLGVNPAKLKADDEMRRIFGSKVVDAEARNDQAGGMVGGSRRVRRLMARGLIKRAQLKVGLLIAPKEHWPPFEGGLAMELAGVNSDGRQTFCYTHSASYHAVQMVFEQSQASFDPNNMMALLQQHPYHVDALLTMHELYRSMGEVASSDEMLERCIYALEMAWHPYFNPATANTRMDYKHPLNRPLFIALFKQTQNLSRRGLHGTALEYAKLLLGLDPTDPRGVLFCIDYLAIRAGQYSFLKRLASEDESLEQLPNFVYSTLLADFRQRTGHTASKPGRGSGFAPAAAPSSSPSEEEAGQEMPLEKRLSQAVMMYPVVVVRLMDKLQDKGVGKDAEWGSLLEKAPLRHADDVDSATLSHAVDIFVERHHLLWKAHDVQRLLKDACSLASQAKPVEQANWACVRAEMFPPSEENQYRHLRIADFSDTVSALPPEELQAAMGGGMGGVGPGVGPQEMQQMQAMAHALQEEVGPQLVEAVQAGMTDAQLAEMLDIPADQAAELIRVVRAGGLAAPPAADQLENLEAANPWAMLIRTFLPWVNAGQVPDYDQEEAEESEDGMDESQHADSQGTEAVAGEGERGAAAADEDDDLD